jgi:hypothetical protein
MSDNPTTGPPDDNAVPPSVDAFIQTDHDNLEDTRRHRPEFRELVPPLNALYAAASALVPPTSDPTFGRALMLCHKAMLSAATSIGRGHPEDAAGTTRRAIETARIALAIRHDPANLDRWVAEKQREARREARKKGGRPPEQIRLGINWPQRHPLLESLGAEMGMLSEIYVHFTPESAARHQWHEGMEGDSYIILLPYHCPDALVTRQQLILLVGFHLKILQVFDQCYDQTCSQDTAWRQMYFAIKAPLGGLSRAFLESKQRMMSGQQGEEGA